MSLFEEIYPQPNQNQPTTRVNNARTEIGTRNLRARLAPAPRRTSLILIQQLPVRWTEKGNCRTIRFGILDRPAAGMRRAAGMLTR